MTSIKEALKNLRDANMSYLLVSDAKNARRLEQAMRDADAALAQLDSADARSGNLRRVVLDLLNGVTPAVENLACHQEQADADGCMVKVSRQALDEVLSAVNEVAVQAATSLSTGLLPNASPGNGAEKVREALQFYADPDNWTDTPSWDGDPDNTTPKAIPILRNEDGQRIASAIRTGDQK